jgi:NADH-quinone oxidoreductase subunit G
VLEVAGTTPPRPLSALVKALDAGEYDWVLALGADVDVDPKTLEAALARAKATIVVAAHEGPLSRAATVALPACSWAEATGTFVNRQGITQKSERALMPHGDAQPGWLVVAKLARALGYAMDWKKLSDVHKAMAPEPRSAGEGAAAAPAEAQV